MINLKTDSINPNRDIFIYCPGCGGQTLAPDSIKSLACGSCGFRFFINCASAAMALIMDDQERLLVTIRKNNPAMGRLDLPGGFAEPGEGIEQTLVREVKEELNLEITRIDYLCSFPNFYPYQSVVYPITDMAFVCKVKSFAPITARDDIAGFRFIHLSEMDITQFGMDSTQNVVRVFLDSLHI